jgi:hypothetical protein
MSQALHCTNTVNLLYTWKNLKNVADKYYQSYCREKTWIYWTYTFVFYSLSNSFGMETGQFPDKELHLRKECRHIRRRFLIYQRHLFRLYRRCICGISNDMSVLQYDQTNSSPETEPGCEVHYDPRCTFVQEQQLNGSYILTRTCMCFVMEGK